jgi:hypothetical protein
MQQGQPEFLQGPGGNSLTANAAVFGNTALGLTPMDWVPETAPSGNARIRKGAIEGFVRTCERWRLTRPEQIVLLGYRGDELAAQPILTGRVRPSQDVLDRSGYVLSISIGLAALYNDSVDAEIEWLTRPHTTLGQATPLSSMLDGKMLSMIRVHDLVSTERGL